MLKFVMKFVLKSSKTFHLIKKLYSDLFINRRGGSLTLEAEKPQKKTNLQKKNKESFIKKLLKSVTLKS